MSVKTENKPLTDAQRNHLLALNAEKQRIEREIENFVIYLATEHNAPAREGWDTIDPVLGFVRKVEESEERDE